uniref:Anaphase-promoting complex subunit 6 n=1 Tax=Peronospora matthiolae TaxID=2874970 RepID=A0AAV1UNC1_9STRA
MMTPPGICVFSPAKYPCYYLSAASYHPSQTQTVAGTQKQEAPSTSRERCAVVLTVLSVCLSLPPVLAATATDIPLARSPAAMAVSPGRRSAPARSESPPLTPERTTRTLAFDSTASSVAASATSARGPKRRRRLAQNRARGWDPRVLLTNEHEDDPNECAEQDDGRLGMLEDGLLEQRRDGETTSLSFSSGGGRREGRGHVHHVRDGPTSKRRAEMRETLRRRVRKCIEQHHVAAALFYADKLVAIGDDADDAGGGGRAAGGSDEHDVLLFADACYLNQEFHRAIHAIKGAGLLDVDGGKQTRRKWSRHVTLRAAWLLGKCMLAVHQKNECLQVLKAVLPEREQDVVRLAENMRLDTAVDEAHGINVVSSLALLMGETFEAIGNRENATMYFRTALRCDVHCSEAFFHLFDKHMLSPQEEKEFVASLDFSLDETKLLERLYWTHVGKYDPIPSIDAKFTEVEQQFGFAKNLDLNVTRAEMCYYQHDVQQAYDVCESMRDRDPFNFRVIPVYVCTLVELGKKRELFQYAHQMVNVYPTKASAWYTVGCYYLLIQKFEAAQRYFHKATSLEPSFAPAWIAFGNSFAAQDESDQAMSSYRTASSLFPGSHLPTLYIGMEFLRTNNLVQAQEFIRQAGVLCPSDPLVYNELGSVYYKQKEYFKAIEMFTKALKLCKGLPERLMEAWEPTLYNLGYSYRKLRKFDQAIHYFQGALRLSPRNASTLAALGFTYHMKGNLHQAIEFYHRALAYAPEDALAGSMITVAFEESLGAGLGSLPEFAEPPPRGGPKTSGLTPLTARRAAKANAGANVFRRLDRSYNSIACSARSSLDFSEDSSMLTMDEA